MTTGRALALFACWTLVLAATPALAERRCGWLENPTPANWWLTDGDGQWIMGTQGGEQAEGMDNLPDITAHDFVATNRDYGYACACLDGAFSKASQRVLKIRSVQQLPIAKCSADSNLPKPGSSE